MAAIRVSIPRRYAKNLPPAEGEGAGEEVSIPRRYAKNRTRDLPKTFSSSVSIPRRYAKNTVCRGGQAFCTRFQSLVGTLKTVRSGLRELLKPQFQSLVGTLKTLIAASELSSLF